MTQAIEKMKTFTRTQTTELLIATLTRLEVAAEVKTLRNGEKVKDFSREERLARAVMLDVIEEREAEEMIDALLESFELETA